MKTSLVLALVGWAVAIQAFWMEDIRRERKPRDIHILTSRSNKPDQGNAPFAEDAYVVFRNVRDYGALGDGTTDDTDAINKAIADGYRCGQNCSSTTETPAVVYFPAGTYLLSSSILPYYMTQLIGDAGDPPTLKASASFASTCTTLGLIDGNPYDGDSLQWLPQNVFYRQIRNFVIDTTAVPSSSLVHGIHWPTAQATSLQNIHFTMPAHSEHIGLLIESGSGGFMADLSFEGGSVGALLGNQQFTMRNFAFDGCTTAIQHTWDWGWTYSGLVVKNADVGINITAGGSSGQAVGSMTVFDSAFINVEVAIASAFTTGSKPDTAGSLVLENIVAKNTAVIVQTPKGDVLEGSASGTKTITAWGQGHKYIPNGPTRFQGEFAANKRPPALLGPGNIALKEGLASAYYVRAKPQYADLNASDFASVRSGGAKGDGVTDDTAALQAVINFATAVGKVVYIDYGVYLVTTTLSIPPGARIVGETYPMLLAASHTSALGFDSFKDPLNPQPVVQIGHYAGQPGSVELSDFVVGTQGSQPGAILIQWNLNSVVLGDGTEASVTNPTSIGGLWDVHTRIGGFAGSDMLVVDCRKDPTTTDIDNKCIAAYMSMRVPPGTAGLYAENVWLWTADHDIEDPDNTQISVYAGRGLDVASTYGPTWLVGTAVEHHDQYQYQLSSTRHVFMGQIQTETPYYQGAATSSALGLVLTGSTNNVFVYGAGMYSFFDNYSQACIKSRTCQQSVASIEGPAVYAISIYNLNTIGVESMIDRDNESLADHADNENSFPDTIAVFRSE
ncbi:glycoside hydrolase family 55 protein [Ophiostoma piceae UAMH 11346]|uniref:Glycoside hydrolase family 55 protein n=1 Tax=Ophiostoma piceae (strain UAMH 11346) TaxID=1262450 RepID=S3CB99_OPHP1|nr:glycoside hydrolase family 55 protein [Ophiostoma piceae UAMH 11346]